MRILITGGAGFIGSQLTNKLLHEGHTILCLDNLSCSSGENIAPFMGDPLFRFINADVCDPLLFHDVDHIYHLACPASPVWYSKDPVKTMMTSVVGTKNVLDLAARTGARVLFTSTSEVYGDPLVHPQPETYTGNVSITGPRACYDEGKRAAETLCADYIRRTGVDVRVVRLFNTYGPNMAYNDGRVISNFITQALEGNSLTIYGDGKQTRSFCYISDMLEMLANVMGSNIRDIGPINLGNPAECTIWEIASLVRELVPTLPDFTHKALPLDDPKVRQPDLTKYNTLFGRRSYVSLIEGIKNTISYFQQYDKYALHP